MPSTPTLVQHVATGMDCYGLTTFKITFPNTTLANNLLVVGFQFNSTGTLTSVVDSNSTSWTSGVSGTNATNGQSMFIYYLANAPATSSVTITVGGLNSAVHCHVHGFFEEWYNIATVSPADGSSAAVATPSRSAGSFTPTNTIGNDLILHWGVALSTNNNFGANYNGTSITAGTSPAFTLQSADLQVGSCVQWYIQPTSTAINPTFTSSGTDTWGSLAIAFKSASAGTAPSSTAIRIVNVQHIFLCGFNQSRTTPITMQFPCSGNLLVGSFNSGDVYVTAVSDSASNTWTCDPSALVLGPSGQAVAQIVYAANATTSPTLKSLSFTLSGTTASDCGLVLYDIVNASTTIPVGGVSCLNTSGTQSTIANLTNCSLYPGNANGLVISTNSIQTNTINAIVGASYILDTVVNAYDDAGAGGTSVSSLDLDNAYGHIYNSNLNFLTFTWGYNSSKTGVAAGNWGSVAVAFNAASATLTVPVLRQTANNNTTSGSTATATFASNTVTGNTIVAIPMGYDGATLRTCTGVTISGGSASFGSAIISQAGSANNYHNISGWAAANITGGTTPTVTATFSGAITSGDLIILELSNMPSSVTTDGTAAGKAGTSASGMTSPAITTTNSNDIIICASAVATGTSSGETNWYPIIMTVSGNLMEFEIVNTTQTALQATSTFSASGVYNAIIFALRGIPASSPPLEVTITGSIVLNATTLNVEFPYRPGYRQPPANLIVTSGTIIPRYSPLFPKASGTILGTAQLTVHGLPIAQPRGTLTIYSTFNPRKAQRAPINAALSTSQTLSTSGVITPRFIIRQGAINGQIKTSGAVNVRFANIIRPQAAGTILLTGAVHGTLRVANQIIVTSAVTARVNQRLPAPVTGTILTSGIVNVRLVGITRIQITGLINTNFGVVHPHLIGAVTEVTITGTLNTSTANTLNIRFQFPTHITLVTTPILGRGTITPRMVSLPTAVGKIYLFGIAAAKSALRMPTTLTGLISTTGTTLNARGYVYPKPTGLITLLNTALNAHEVGTVRMPITGFITLGNTVLMVGLQPTRIQLNSKVIAIFSSILNPRLVTPTHVRTVYVTVAGYYVVLNVFAAYDVMYLFPGINYAYLVETIELNGPYSSWYTAFLALIGARYSGQLP